MLYAIGGGWGDEQPGAGKVRVAVIRGTDIPKLRIGDHSSVPFRYESESKVRSRLLRVGDIVIEVSGGSAASGQHTGRSLLVTGEILQSLGGKVIPASFCRLLRLDTQQVHPGFVVLQIDSLHRSGEIAEFENQSTGIANFQFNRFVEETHPRIKELDAQATIVEYISSFDRLIALNRRINRTLEAMAQAIFKSWFVDFDPVKAKIAANEQGEDPLRAAMRVISGKTDAELDQMPREHHDQLAATAALFPDAMQESELGEIPKGWRVRQLPDVIDFLEGPGIRNWQYTEAEDGIKFINIRCIKDGDLKLDTANKITQEEAFGKYSHFQLSEDDIVISISGTLGRFGFVRKSHLPLSLNTSVVRFRAIQNVSTLHFIAGFVDTQLQSELEIRASGSAQRNFGPMHLKQIELLLPEYQVLKAHAEIVEHLFRKRQKNLEQIDNLTQLRDSLLPKLLSGELRMEATEM